MKKILTICVLIFSLFMLTGCDDINAVISLLPKFDTTLPNNLDGKWAYFDSEEERLNNEFTRQFTFDSKEQRFKLEISGAGTITKSGSYSVQYKTYTITECNGTLTLYYEDNSVEKYNFYYKATAIDGPEYITLSNSGTYYYGGKK